MEFKREFCSRWGQAVVGHVFKEKYNKQNLYHKCPKVNSGEVWTEDELLALCWHDILACGKHFVIQQKKLIYIFKKKKEVS